jgi:ketosteroid isomerase-like protein
MLADNPALKGGLRMSNVFLGLVSLLLAAAPASNTAAAQAELMRIDAEFSAAAQKLGVGEAFLHYAAADAVMLPENQNAVKGHAGIREQFAGFPAGATLAWKPFHADVAASGDLGYTLGTFELRGKPATKGRPAAVGNAVRRTAVTADGQPSVRYGKYCSVWKRQADGSWKWVVDVGTPSPAPK